MLLTNQLMCTRLSVVNCTALSARCTSAAASVTGAASHCASSSSSGSRPLSTGWPSATVSGSVPCFLSCMTPSTTAGTASMSAPYRLLTPAVRPGALAPARSTSACASPVSFSFDTYTVTSATTRLLPREPGLPATRLALATAAVLGLRQRGTRRRRLPRFPQSHRLIRGRQPALRDDGGVHHHGGQAPEVARVELQQQ